MYNNIRCASVKALASIGLSEEQAKTIRKTWKAETWEDIEKIHGEQKIHDTLKPFHNEPPLEHVKQILINEIGEYHGVEYLGTYKRTGEEINYCNAGDTYVGTIMFLDNKLIVSCWGHFVESGLVREQDNF